MRKLWTDRAWDDYVFWQTQDKKTLRRINQIIKDIERTGYCGGIGKAEPLKNSMSGWWSRRIDDINRIVYRIKDGNLEISQCRGHYD